MERARAFAKKLDAPLAIVDKRRVDVDVSEVMHLIGDVRGRPALVIDDIIDTAGTLVKTAEALLKEGATEVFAACTHPVLSGPAVERLCRSPISEVVVTDSVPLSRRGAPDRQDQSAERGGTAGAGNPFDSRRDIDQRTVYLDFVRAPEGAKHNGQDNGEKNMDQITVEAKPRDDRGKNAARRMRRAGQVPAVLYGGEGGSLTLSVNTKQLAAILRSQSGHNTIFKVKLPNGRAAGDAEGLAGGSADRFLLHVDLLRVAMDVRMRVKVPMHTFGEPQGVKLQGGIFEMVTREVEIECLPSDIPTEIRVDISELMIGKQLRMGDLPIDTAKIKLVTDPLRVVGARGGPARRRREAGGSRGSRSRRAGRARGHQEGQEGSGRGRRSRGRAGRPRKKRRPRSKRAPEAAMLRVAWRIPPQHTQNRRVLGTPGMAIRLARRCA